MLSNLRFVRRGETEGEGGGEGDSLLCRAVEAVRKKGVEPEWAGSGIAKGDRGCVYVMDNFDCSEFKAVSQSGKCRVIGPAVVLAHIKHGWPLPASTQPVFSMAMRGVVACFTQTGARERREQLSQLVRLMGGKVQKDYTKHVTHLIAGQVGSTKYNVARDLCMPVMLPSWVDHCWTHGLDSEISALDSTILKAHSCPPFTGCTVTVTGLEERERRKVREVVERNGGVYSGELTKDSCTHLLVGSTTSTKYKFAQQWQIYCISAQWLYDSAERGYCQSEEKYSVEGGGGGGGGKEGGGGGGGSKEGGEGVGGGKKQSTEKGVEGPPEWMAAVEEFQLPAVTESCFLDGCRLYLAGFSDQELEKLHKIVNLGGGARYNHLSESLTHVVLGRQDPSTVAGIRRLGETPHVVSALWLLACCTSGDRVEEQPHTCLDLTPSSETNGVGEERGKGGVKRKRKREGEGEETGSKRPRVGGGQGERGEAEETGMEEEELLLQYQNAEFPAAAEEGGGGSKEDDGGGGVTEGQGGGVLLGKKTAVSCLFSTDDQAVAASILRGQGGVVVRPSQADYLLFPLEVAGKTGSRTQEENSSHATPVTMIWLQRSIEAREILDPASYFLFQPLATKIVDTTLSGCVLAFSQFSDREREHLIRFSKGLGALVQDYFTHYPGHGLLATTHIVLKTALGEKYSHAVKWGIPAVADSWLFACAKIGSIAPVEEHLLTPPPPPDHQTDPGGGAADLETAGGGEEETEVESDGRATESAPVERQPTVEGAELVVQGETATDNDGDLPAMDASTMSGDTPFKEFIPKFNLTEAYKVIPPDSQPGENTQLAQIFMENIKVGVQNVLAAQIAEEEEEEGEGEEGCREEEEGDGEEGGGKGEEERDGEEGGGKGEEERSGVLAGVVLCLHKKTSAQYGARLHNLAGSLGADCHWAFDAFCTHYVYQGKAAEAGRDREVRAARDSGCSIVSPHWIHACVSEGRRVEESSYPHTYNPNMALNVSTVRTSTQQRRETMTASQPVQVAATLKTAADSLGSHLEPRPQPHPHVLVEPELEMERREEEECKWEQDEGDGGGVAQGGEERGEEEEEEERNKGEVDGEEDGATSEFARKFQQQLEEIKEAPRDTRRRKSRRLQQKDPEAASSTSSTAAAALPPPKVPPSPSLSSRLRRGRRNRKKEESLTDSQISDSQVLQVTYDDPEGRMEKAKLLARIEREEELRAQGLDPGQFRDSSTSSEDTTVMAGPRDLQLTLPSGSHHLDRMTNTAATAAATARGKEAFSESSAAYRTGQQTSILGPIGLGKSNLMEEVSGDVRVGGGGDKDKDTPSSTPLPPPLGVPIVTHSKGKKQVKSLFDEKAMQTRKRAKTPPRFLLSSLEQREKVDYGALIQELGGEYVELDYFTIKCTHLIVGKASRTEKFLGACAAGKWVLHKSYMEACRAEHRFVEEESHEWGVSVGGNEVQPLEYAPRRWRVALAEHRKEAGQEAVLGAFQGWKAVLFAERNKMAGLKRLLEAGGAKVYGSGSKLLPEELRQVSHAFINMNYFPKDSLSLDEMAKRGVACLKPDYIAEYLSKGKDIPIEPFFINEVKLLLNR